ncbi:hypothetical protein E4U37_003197, partial [Claviceps purpurea]
IIDANGKRWHSFYQAADRFIALEGRISKFWQEWNPLRRAEVPTPDLLTSEDWEELRSTNEALRVFGVATLAVEGHKTFLSNWLSVMDGLLNVINHVKTDFEERRAKDRAIVNEHTNPSKRKKTKDKESKKDSRKRVRLVPRELGSVS